MSDIDSIDDTNADHERFERRLLSQDRDADRVSTADIDRTTARQLVSNLLDDGDVRPIPDHRTLVHEPSGQAFDSILQLAIFHQGWTAARPPETRG
jgi:hypothetical protein